MRWLCRCCPPGLSAVSTALLSVLGAGDHLLVTDSVYRPTRTFCDTILKRLGIETTYYDPLIGGGIAALIKTNTRAVFVETPGSQSFEMQDVPAIAAAPTTKGAVVLMDNTWGDAALFPRVRQGRRSLDPGRHQIYRRPLRHHARHRSANAKTAERLKTTVGTMGLCVGPDDMYLAQRGLRTLGVRLARHQKALEDRALACAAAGGRAGDASGAGKRSGPRDLEARLLRRERPVQHRAQAGGQKAVHAFMDALTLFGMGFSWGGYESLVILFDCTEYRTATKWAPGGPTLRFHIGLEDPGDLIADLESGFAAMAAAG